MEPKLSKLTLIKFKPWPTSRWKCSLRLLKIVTWLALSAMHL